MKILITGGAGFIGSNLVDHFLALGCEVVCLDNLSTGFVKNIEHNFGKRSFKFINGDIRDLETCRQAVVNCQLVSHQAALGSVPRSIADPINTNSVNIDGFLNLIVAARDAKAKRIVYASSSSVYGDSKKLPKIEEETGRALSPYAITKQVNELYADVFAKTYGMQFIGLRYFNVFGKRQDPNGPYAAVIPLWIKKLINYESPVINGDGTYSRDFTYIDNVIQANEKALFTPEEQIIKGQKEYYNLELEEHKFCVQKVINKSQNQEVNNYFHEVFNVAYGANITLNELYNSLRKNLSFFDEKIADIKSITGPFRFGDIPHSLASIKKAKTILGYNPIYSADKGFALASEWYYFNILSKKTYR